MLYGMLKNMRPYGEHTHREQLGLFNATEVKSSVPVDISLELVDLVAPESELMTDEASLIDELQLAPELVP